METAEEILQKHIYKNVESFGDAVTVEGALSAMEEYLNQFKGSMITMMQNGVTLHNGKCQCTALNSITFLENKFPLPTMFNGHIF